MQVPMISIIENSSTGVGKSMKRSASAGSTIRNLTMHTAPMMAAPGGQSFVREISPAQNQRLWKGVASQFQA